MIKLAVIIPTYNRKSYLRILLQQLASQEKIKEIELIIVVVIDGSNDGTLEMLKEEFPSIYTIAGNGKWWWTRCVNEGIKFSLSKFTADYVLLLNDDSQVESDYIYELFNATELAGEKSIVGSISVTDKYPLRVSFSGIKSINWITLKKRSYFKNFELFERLPTSGLFPTYALNGRGTIIKSSIIKDLNFLNERQFPQYGSDDDLVLRAWENGYNVVVSYSCKIIDRTHDTSKGTAFRQDSPVDFLKSFFTWNSVNYIPKQLRFYYSHGITVLIPFYLLKFILGTFYAYCFKYRKLKYEL